jgi:predicted PurR-regulated permease PerM
MNTPRLHQLVFLSLLLLVTLAFGWVLSPYFGAVFWAMVLAMLFNGPFQWIKKKFNGRATLAALVTLMICLIIVVLPLALVAVSLVSDIVALTQRINSGEIDFKHYYQQVIQAIPPWATQLADRFGFSMTNLDDFVEKIGSAALQAGQVVTQHALAIGQNTFQFMVSFVIMLYVLFFLLRDGVAISQLIRNAIPMAKPHTHYLLNKFTTVIRATVKGNVVVAVVQGALGALAFWFLGIKGAVFWGVVMAFLSLLPAVGAALVWGPVAIYLLATGQTWQGIALMVWGSLVIGMVDNVLRPVLVGKDTKLPDYVVLLSTIGGMSLFGINGFVIGPTIAAMFMAFWALFNYESEQDEARAALARQAAQQADAPDA